SLLNNRDYVNTNRRWHIHGAAYASVNIVWIPYQLFSPTPGQPAACIQLQQIVRHTVLETPTWQQPRRAVGVAVCPQGAPAATERGSCSHQETDDKSYPRKDAAQRRAMASAPAAVAAGAGAGAGAACRSCSSAR